MTASPAVTDGPERSPERTPLPSDDITEEPPTPSRRKLACCCSSCCCSSPSLGLAMWYLLFRQPIALPTIPGEVVMPGYSTSFYGAQRPMGVAVNAAGDRVYIGETSGDNTARVFDGQGNELARMEPPLSTGRDHAPVYLARQPGHERGLRLGPPHGVHLRLRRGRHVPADVRAAG